MSRAKKPTREQKIIMTKKSFIAKNWLILQDTGSELKLVSKATGKTRTIKKSA